MKRLLLATTGLVMLATPAWASPIVENGNYGNDSSILWYHGVIGDQSTPASITDISPGAFLELSYWVGSPTDPYGATSYGGLTTFGAGPTDLSWAAPGADIIVAASWANNDPSSPGDTSGLYPFSPLGHAFTYDGFPTGSVTVSHWTCSQGFFCFGVNNGNGQSSLSFDGFNSVEALNDPVGVVEPRSASLLLIGLLGLGGLAWRRRE